MPDIIAHRGYVQRYDSNGRTVEHGVEMYGNGNFYGALHLSFTSPKSGISKNYYIAGDALDELAAAVQDALKARDRS